MPTFRQSKLVEGPESPEATNNVPSMGTAVYETAVCKERWSKPGSCFAFGLSVSCPEKHMAPRQPAAAHDGHPGPSPLPALALLGHGAFVTVRECTLPSPGCR